MDAETSAVIIILAFACIALVTIAEVLRERYYLRKHPPDDGTREEWFDDED